jgi:hypothetical protein
MRRCWRSLDDLLSRLAGHYELPGWLSRTRPPGAEVFSHVGVRADEPLRSGLVSHEDWIHTEMPFKSRGGGTRHGSIPACW